MLQGYTMAIVPCGNPTPKKLPTGGGEWPTFRTARAQRTVRPLATILRLVHLTAGTHCSCTSCGMVEVLPSDYADPSFLLCLQHRDIGVQPAGSGADIPHATLSPTLCVTKDIYKLNVWGLVQSILVLIGVQDDTNFTPLVPINCTTHRGHLMVRGYGVANTWLVGFLLLNG